MKILFCGGGTGGHFYPIIAVSEALRERAKERKILMPKLYYMASSKYNPRALFDQEIEFIPISTGKIRRYFSLLNVVDAFKTIFGTIGAIMKVFSIYPDVVFGKGAYMSFPVLFAARIWRIPVVIHESDSKPGRVNAWAGKFAKKIAISYPDSAIYFKKHPDVVALTGNPVRSGIAHALSNGAYEFLHLENGVPVVLVLGGSQGSQAINDVVINSLPELLNNYQVIHQTGKANIEEIKSTTSVILKDHPYSYRYHPFEYLDELALRMSAGACDIVISRAGSTIFEIALWGKPSIIVPLPAEVSHDQSSNAFAYSRTGAAVAIEQNNLTTHVLIEEVNRIVGSPTIKNTMIEKAKAFSRADSAAVIADALLDIGLKHEK